MDMGPNYMTAMLNLLGPLRRVTAFGGRARDSRQIATGPRARAHVPVAVDTDLAGVMEFAQGALVQITTSFEVRGHRHGPLELYGTDGSMTIPDPDCFDGTVELLQEGEWRAQATKHGHGDGNYRGLALAQMAAAIRTGSAHCANGDLALHALEVMEAMHRSASAGKAIEITRRCEWPAPPAAGLSTGEIALQSEAA